MSKASCLWDFSLHYVPILAFRLLFALIVVNVFIMIATNRQSNKQTEQGRPSTVGLNLLTWEANGHLRPMTAKSCNQWASSASPADDHQQQSNRTKTTHLVIAALLTPHTEAMTPCHVKSKLLCSGFHKYVADEERMNPEAEQRENVAKLKY